MNYILIYSRISDYKHHPEDVIGGAMLGSLVAALAHFISTNSVKQGYEQLTYYHCMRSGAFTDGWVGGVIRISPPQPPNRMKMTFSPFLIFLNCMFFPCIKLVSPTPSVVCKLNHADTPGSRMR